MKRPAALLLCLLLVLSLIPAAVLTASAEDEAPGLWTTLRAGNDYGDEENYVPAPGYEYTSEGFHTVSPDYTDCSVFSFAQTKVPVDLAGIHLEFRVDQFPYGGADGYFDHWIALSIWTQEMHVPGSVAYGSGWLLLLRGQGDGMTKCQSFWTEGQDKEKGQNGRFPLLGETPVNVPADNGREVYTLDVTLEDGAYVLKLNGVEIAGGGELSDSLKASFPDGKGYLGLTLYDSTGNAVGAETPVAEATILNFNGSIPTGSDSKVPEENLRYYIWDDYDPADYPVLLFDAATPLSRKGPYACNLTMTPTENNTYLVRPEYEKGYFTWEFSSKYCFSAEDYPVICLLFKDFDPFVTMTLRYCAGEVRSAVDKYHVDRPVDPSENGYSMVVINLISEGEDWEGRINGFSVAFGAMVDKNPFEVCYAAFFRSEAEAEKYTHEYLYQQGVIEDETRVFVCPSYPETLPETTDVVNVPREPLPGETAETIPAPIRDTAPSSYGGDGSQAVDGISVEQTGGCAAGVSGTVLLLFAAAALFAARKKH